MKFKPTVLAGTLALVASSAHAAPPAPVAEPGWGSQPARCSWQCSFRGHQPHSQNHRTAFAMRGCHINPEWGATLTGVPSQHIAMQ